MTCQVRLRWYELVPLFSFLVQGAKCRHCKHSLNWQYPIVELLTAGVTVVIPYFFLHFYGTNQLLIQGLTPWWHFVAIGIWLLISYTMILLSAIDLRLRIIPDQCNALLALLGIALLAMRSVGVIGAGAFAGPYASILGDPGTPWLSALYGVLFALLLFGGTIFFTRGRGMGLGDLKLALPIGIILGWPDSCLAAMAAFVIGSIIGVLLIAGKKATMKAAVPFGPFIVVGFYVAIFYGEDLLRWYFSLL